MARLRGENTRLQVDLADRSTNPDATPEWKNAAGEVSLGGGFAAALDTSNTKDNTSGFSEQAPVTLSGTLDVTCTYSTDQKLADDLDYKNFFDYWKAKSPIIIQVDSPVFTLSAKVAVINVSLNAPNTGFTEYTISLRYNTVPKFVPKTS